MSVSVFQTHEGLHRFLVLFFRASPASEIFHNLIKEAIREMAVVSIHGNILIYAPKAHECSLIDCFQRLKEKGLTLRRKKCKFGKTSVSWFGYIFSGSEMSAGLKKLEVSYKHANTTLSSCLIQRGKMRKSTTTLPLRELTKKGSHFAWTQQCDKAYKEILKLMTTETAL